VAQRWHRGGTEVAQRWHRGGTEVAQRWQRGGTEVAERWERGGFEGCYDVKTQTLSRDIALCDMMMSCKD